ncbi:MAG: hypothetical protein U5K54_19260 [Cytophagales bacterium]|nr:hypothetical protein [Cytophagales bacterium]
MRSSETSNKDQQVVSEEQIHKWVQTAVIREQIERVKRVYFLSRYNSFLMPDWRHGPAADAGSVGPMRIKPGLIMERNYMRDFSQGSFILDLNNRSNIKVWRINASTHENSYRMGETMIDRIVAKDQKICVKPGRRRGTK